MAVEQAWASLNWFDGKQHPQYYVLAETDLPTLFHNFNNLAFY